MPPPVAAATAATAAAAAVAVVSSPPPPAAADGGQGGCGRKRGREGPQPPKSPLLDPLDLYDTAAEVLVEWLRMRCGEGGSGHSPGLVITGKAGCGKLTAVRWAMGQAGLDLGALEVFHPWSAESAASLEESVVKCALSSSRNGVIGSRGGVEVKRLPYRVLVVKHAELWALRASTPAAASSCSRALGFSYWTRLFRTAAGPEAATPARTPPPRVAIILLFPDLSLPKARHLVGMRGARQETQLAEATEPGAPTSSGLVPWKHIELDRGLLMRLDSVSDRLLVALRRSPSLTLPFDGDLRAVFRRLADSCRFHAPHKLDMNYNIFRACNRLLGPSALSLGDVRGALDQDDRLFFMLWFHAPSFFGPKAPQSHIAADRARWSCMDVSFGGEGASGWQVAEWRLWRGSLGIGKRGAAGGPMTFEMPPRSAAQLRDKAPRSSVEYNESARLPPRVIEYGFRFVSF